MLKTKSKIQYKDITAFVDTYLQLREATFPVHITIRHLPRHTKTHHHLTRFAPTMLSVPVNMSSSHSSLLLPTDARSTSTTPPLIDATPSLPPQHYTEAYEYYDIIAQLKYRFRRWSYIQTTEDSLLLNRHQSITRLLIENAEEKQ